MGGYKIPHKALHRKDLAPKLAELVWGSIGKAYVEDHLDLDRASLRKRKPQISKPNIPPKTTVAEADVKTTLQKSLEEMFQIIDEFPKLSMRKQERNVPKKPKSGLGSLFHIFLVLAALSGLADWSLADSESVRRTYYPLNTLQNVRRKLGLRTDVVEDDKENDNRIKMIYDA